MVVEKLAYLSRQLRQVESSAAQTRRERIDKRRAVVVRLLKALEADYAAEGDDIEVSRIQVAAMLMETDGRGVLGALAKTAMVDFDDALRLAVMLADGEAADYMGREDYGKMNIWNERGHSVEQLRKQLQ